MFLATGATAPPEPVVTDADIERVRQEQPTITEADIEQARRKHQASVEPEAAPMSSPPVSSPILDALPQPVTKTPIDLDALARGFPMDTQGIQAFNKDPALFVFVSLAMPRPALERLVEQAARARARLVIRGFANGSLKETVAQIQPLIGTREVAIQIDPRAFDRYGVDKVPSFVLERAGTPKRACAADTCGYPDAYVLVAGDVSLAYALESMQRLVPAFGMEAAHFIKRLNP
jgi:conjugal transfer pilus assembly protein TrbC